ILLGINGFSVYMLIDSGCHFSFISKSCWKRIRKPKLERVNFAGFGPAFQGCPIKLVGQFIATVQYGHRKFKLPLMVTSESNSYLDSLNINILGRAWLCCINLDWNK
ncbi:Uncharacterized protein APZ42_001011, partial [Daphnia magna]